MVEHKIYNGMEYESTQNETFPTKESSVNNEEKTLFKCVLSTKRNLKNTIDLIDKIYKIVGIYPLPDCPRVNVDSFADDLLDNENLSANIYESINEIKLFLIGHDEEDEVVEDAKIH